MYRRVLKRNASLVTSNYRLIIQDVETYFCLYTYHYAELILNLIKTNYIRPSHLYYDKVFKSSLQPWCEKYNSYLFWICFCWGGTSNCYLYKSSNYPNQWRTLLIKIENYVLEFIKQFTQCYNTVCSKLHYIQVRIDNELVIYQVVFLST